MKEPDSLISQVLDEMYDKALRDGSAPVFLSDGRAYDCWPEVKETFPDEP